MPLCRIVGAALPENVAGGAEADEALLPAITLVGSAEPLKVIVVGPSSVMVDVRVLVR
jgi:hypothetical protein